MRNIALGILVLIVFVFICTVGVVIGRWTSDLRIRIGREAEVVVVTPTPDAGATATAIVEEARADAETLLSEAQALLNEVEIVDSPEEAASLLETAEAILETVGQMPVSTEIVVAPTPTQSSLRFAVVDDNSVTSGVREETVTLLRLEYPGAEVVGFSACVQQLFDQKWSGVVMDHDMRGSSMHGPECTKTILENYPETIVVGYTRGGSNHKDMLSAGAVASCNKRGPNCILENLSKDIDS